MSAKTEGKELIYEAIAAVMAEVSPIDKNNENKSQHFKFRGIEDVMNSLHGIMKKHGVFILTDVTDHRMDAFETKSGTQGFHHITKVTYWLVAKDGSRVPINSIGEAMDYGDKGATKTLSVALKYALVNAFLIPTRETAADDPDLNSHEVKAASKKPEQAAPKPAPQAEKPWHETVWWWKKSEHGGKTLGDMASDGEVEALSKAFKFCESKAGDEPGDPWAKKAALLSKALAEAQAVRDLGGGKGSDNPEEVSDEDIPF